jgi:selenide, water dikinase
VLAGTDGAEDAGVYQLSDELALVQTVDFFTPIVDDPREFGQVAAANSLSDVYAMGGRPITAMNVVGFPIGTLGVEVLQQILAGGLDILIEAGVALVGGHSVKDNEPKYGLSVTGLVHPAQVMTNDALRPGDRLVLTKPIGTGVIGTATKQGKAEADWIDASFQSMRTLNRAASESAVANGLRACTDVTGFGLLGHLTEMVRASGVSATVFAHAVPLLPGALTAASAGLIPGGSKANREHFGAWIELDAEVDEPTAALLFDAQTSGGLLLGVPAAAFEDLTADLDARGCLAAALVGQVTGEHADGHVTVEP